MADAHSSGTTPPPETNDMKKHLKTIAGAAVAATLLVGCPRPDGAGDT